jgi:phosphatidylglycerol:prolipoprotein diacylglycerol transferase
MIDGFNVPWIWLLLAGIPLFFVIVALVVRSLFEGEDRKKKRNVGNPYIWTGVAALLGVGVWFLFRRMYSGSLHIYFYGILIMIGVIAAAALAYYEAVRRNLDPEIILDMLFWAVLGGIIGARLWHVFTPPPSMLVPDPISGDMVNPYFVGGFPRMMDILNIRNGGLGIPGAVIGGALAVWIYCRKKKLSFLTWADVVVPGLALAQAIGRWGNFFNQEVYGKPTDLPWKIFIEPLRRVSGYEKYEYFHPLFLYESLYNLMAMAILLWLGRRFPKWLKEGDLFLIYLILYPVGRFFLDFLRLDAAQLGGVNANQTFVAIVALVSAGLLIYRHKFARK